MAHSPGSGNRGSGNPGDRRISVCGPDPFRRTRTPFAPRNGQSPGGLSRLRSASNCARQTGPVANRGTSPVRCFPRFLSLAKTFPQPTLADLARSHAPLAYPAPYPFVTGSRSSPPLTYPPLTNTPKLLQKNGICRSHLTCVGAAAVIAVAKSVIR